MSFRESPHFLPQHLAFALTEPNFRQESAGAVGIQYPESNIYHQVSSSQLPAHHFILQNLNTYL